MKHSLRFVLMCVATTLCIGAIPGVAQETSYQAMSDKFFDLVQQGKATDAVQYLTATNPSMNKIPDQIEQLKTQFGSVVPLMGNYISHRLLVESKVADMYVYQHYFVAYERQPISVRISYYKPGKTWVCYAVSFDVKLTDEIQSASDEKLPLDVK